MFLKYFSIVLLLLQSFFCWSQQSFGPIDANATVETKALYRNLHKLSKQYILFGHQHATEYGHGWQGDENRSDVKSVTGSHPAVIGVDFSGLSGRPEDQIEKAIIIHKELRSENAIIQQLLEYGFTDPQSKKIVKSNSQETIINSIKSVDIQVSRGKVKNAKAMLTKAIQEKWHPEKYQNKTLKFAC